MRASVRASVSFSCHGYSRASALLSLSIQTSQDASSQKIRGIGIMIKGAAVTEDPQDKQGRKYKPVPPPSGQADLLFTTLEFDFRDSREPSPEDRKLQLTPASTHSSAHKTSTNR